MLINGRIRGRDTLYHWARISFAIICCVAATHFFHYIHSQSVRGAAGLLREPDGGPTVDLIMATVAKDDVSWVNDCVRDRGWRKVVYTADSKIARHRVPVNKGREAMVYLTYIIENYERLPDIAVFIHADRYQWHTDDPLYDQVPTLRELRLPTVLSKGYVQLRCTWSVGCPEEMKPVAAQKSEGIHTDNERAYAQEFQKLFPGSDLPDVVAVSCCSQFALSRAVIRGLPRAYYEDVRQWLIDTPLDDATSGRILEYSWHIMFGMPAVHCPSPQECYCETYGLCNLKCDNANCEGRYVLPPYSNMPKGWPEYGWDHKPRISPGH